MIDAAYIRQLAVEKLRESDSYLVDVTVSAGNKIRVTIDNFHSISIEECISMSRWIESHLDRDKEDFELEVSSPGLDQPFRVFRQYEKNIGKEVEVRLTDGSKVTGKLISAAEDSIAIEQQSKEKVEGKKGRQLVTRRLTFPFEQVKETRIVIKF